MTCKICSTKNPLDAKYCERCGKLLTRIWTIGRGEGCDPRVDCQGAGRQHCRLELRDSQYWLTDLGSQNGTLVNGVLIEVATRVTPEDKITLGNHCAFKWPNELVALRNEVAIEHATKLAQKGRLRIGRAVDNDIRINEPSVSRYHAELTFANGVWTLTDLNSSAGTSLHKRGEPIKEPTPVQDNVLVFFGNHGKVLKELLAEHGVNLTENFVAAKDRTIIGRAPKVRPDEGIGYYSINHPSVSQEHAEVTRLGGMVFITDLNSLNGTFVNGERISPKAKEEVRQGDIISIGPVGLVLQPGRGNSTEFKIRRDSDIVISAEGVCIGTDGNFRLQDVSLTVFPGELVAVMGPSGHGKSTLLKALCGYSRPTQGSVLYNGENLYTSPSASTERRLIGYVPQDDIVHSELTVSEALFYTGRLRTDNPADVVRKDIDRILKELNLADKKMARIGGPADDKKISGGQRKRVNIAMELLCDPTVFFLDEPTSGLSSKDSEELVDLLSTIATKGRKSVVAVIHAPSPEVFATFNLLAFIQKNPPPLDENPEEPNPGLLTYYGPAYPDSIEFFNSQRAAEARSSRKELRADWIFDGIKDAGQDSLHWQQRYHNSPHKHKEKYIDNRREQPEVARKGARAKHRYFSRAWVLFQRSALIKWRDGIRRLFIIGQPVMFAVLIALVFRGLGPQSFENLEVYSEFVSKLSSVHYLLAVAALWFGANEAVREIAGELAVHIREQQAGVPMLSYILSKYAILGVIALIQVIVVAVVAKFVCPLDAPLGPMIVVLWLCSLVGVAMGLCVSAIGAILRAAEAVVAALPILVLPMIFLSGGMIPLHKMPTIVSITVNGKAHAFKVRHVAAVLVPTRWAFEANFVQESEGRLGKITVPAIPGCSDLRTVKQEKAMEAWEKTRVGKQPHLDNEDALNKACEGEAAVRYYDIAAEPFPDPKKEKAKDHPGSEANERKPLIKTASKTEEIPNRTGWGECVGALGAMLTACTAMVWILMNRLLKQAVR